MHSSNTPLVLLLGVLALIWAVLAYLVQQRFLNRAVRTTGVVESLEVQRTSKSTVYFPIIRFATAAGASVTARGNRGSSGHPYQVGQTLPVLYDPDHPDKLEVDKFWTRWAMVALAVGIALVLFIVGIGSILYPNLVG
jgi:uncharacterized protein DUF3592